MAIKRAVFTLLLFLLWTQGGWSWWNGRYVFEDACNKIARSIAKQKVVYGKRLAVLDFQAISGASSLMDIYLALKLTVCLYKQAQGRFFLVDRLDIARLMDELEVYGPEDFSLDTWVKDLKADLLVRGTYTWLKAQKKMLVNIRLVQPETGNLVFSCEQEIKLDQDLERILTTPKPRTHLALSLESVSSLSPASINAEHVSLYLYKNGQKIPLQGEAPAIKAGEKIGFSVTPPIDSKLYVFNYDPMQGDVIFLYPLAVLKPIIFKKGKTYFFPECIDPKAISYPVEPPYGRMCFKVIGISKDIAIDLTAHLKAKDGYFILTRKELGAFLNMLKLIPPASWWEESLDFWIIE